MDTCIKGCRISILCKTNKKTEINYQIKSNNRFYFIYYNFQKFLKVGPFTKSKYST